MTTDDWQEYEESVARFFLELGAQATRGKSLSTAAGATYDIDVVVDFTYQGLPVTWIIECKAWNKPVSAEKASTLIAIVADLGVDRGILMSESGFQSGATRRVRETNVHLSSLKALRESTAPEVEADFVRRANFAADFYRTLLNRFQIAAALNEPVDRPDRSALLFLDVWLSDVERREIETWKDCQQTTGDLSNALHAIRAATAEGERFSMGHLLNFTTGDMDLVDRERARRLIVMQLNYVATMFSQDSDSGAGTGKPR